MTFVALNISALVTITSSHQYLPDLPPIYFCRIAVIQRPRNLLRVLVEGGAPSGDFPYHLMYPLLPKPTHKLPRSQLLLEIGSRRRHTFADRLRREEVVVGMHLGRRLPIRITCWVVPVAVHETSLLHGWYGILVGQGWWGLSDWLEDYLLVPRVSFGRHTVTRPEEVISCCKGAGRLSPFHQIVHRVVSLARDLKNFLVGAIPF